MSEPPITVGLQDSSRDRTTGRPDNENCGTTRTDDEDSGGRRPASHVGTRQQPGDDFCFPGDNRPRLTRAA